MRRAGYTNAMYTPVTWSNNAVVGATILNQQLRDNILALDNRSTPALPSVVHWTTPNPSETVTNGTKVFLARPSTYINMLEMSEYSPHLHVSIDISMNVSFADASAFSVEAALYMRQTPWQNPSQSTEHIFRYTPRVLDSSGYWINGSNIVSGSSVGSTQYSFWTGFKRHDTLGQDPFALTASKYYCDVSLAVSATNGSVTSNLGWALRFRANSQETISYLAEDAGAANLPQYGQTAT